jgi:hypothetical protein
MTPTIMKTVKSTKILKFTFLIWVEVTQKAPHALPLITGDKEVVYCVLVEFADQSARILELL